jgi:2-(1,2-epoxy-1,2-dihydrophenyl)acetyl-CoA isomerase
MNDSVLYEQQQAVAIITLNRPNVLNALNPSLMAALHSALSRAANPDVRAVLITGAGRAFCAGADLTSIPMDSSNFKPGATDPGKALVDTYNPIIELIRGLNKPIITAVNGPAAGAGMSIALAGDIILASQSATFLQAFARLGLVPDAGGTWFLPRLIGEARARAMSLLAEPITASQALEFGMLWKVYEDAQLMPAAHAMAQTLANQATYGLGLIKQAFNASANHTLEQQLQFEASLQTKAGQSPDFYEGVLAFVQKRPAQFSGK